MEDGAVIERMNAELIGMHEDMDKAEVMRGDVENYEHHWMTVRSRLSLALHERGSLWRDARKVAAYAKAVAAGERPDRPSVGWSGSREALDAIDALAGA